MSLKLDSLCQGDTQKTTTEMDEVGTAISYSPIKILGFNGKIKRGLKVHPDGKHMVYAVGRFIIIEELSLKTIGGQRVLANRKGQVTALTVCPDGRLIASSQESTIRQKAVVLLWEFSTGQLLMERSMHKESVYALIFTFSTKFLISLGCQDDGCLVIWHCRKREPFCGHVAQALSSSVMLCVAASKLNDCIFATGGDGYGRIWTLNDEDKSVDYVELKYHISRRVITTMEITDEDNKEMPLLLCGTTSGDIMTFHLKTGCLQCVVAFKPPVHGLTALVYLRLKDSQTLDLIAGTGDGELHHCLLKITSGKDGRHTGKLVPYGNMKAWKHSKGASAITSIARLGSGESVYVGAEKSHMYRFNLTYWNEELVHTSCSDPVEAIAFARDSDDLLLVGTYQTVRIINTAICLEVRRYVRVNRYCKALAVNHDGTNIFSGWDCGTVIVLGFAPKDLGLKELYRIVCVQTQCITCLALTATSDVLISGGKDGHSRVWRLSEDLDAKGKKLRQGVLIHTLAGQFGEITAIAIAKSQQTFVSSSLDHTLVIYDIASGNKVRILEYSLGLTCVCFLNDDMHVVASGNDGNLHFWEILTAESFRELKGCSVGQINCVAASRCTKYGASVAKDELVKFWNFETGEITHIGQGHGDNITKVKYAPCGSIVVTGANDGSLCIWRNPNMCD